MISRSFCLVRNNLKTLHKVNPAFTHGQNLRFHIISCSSNFITKQYYGFSNFFQSFKIDEKMEDEPQKPKTSKVDQNSKPKTENKKSDIPLSASIKNFAKQLEEEQSYFTAPLYHTKTYHYASFLLKAVRLLHQRKAFTDEKILKIYFREVKNSIKSAQTKKFTPKSALKLIEQFALIDFDGDESITLEKIVSYVEKNSLQFSEYQLQEYQTAYQNIMVNKAFGPVKFRPLTIQKSYRSEDQRKLKVTQQKIFEKLKISSEELQKGVNCQQSRSKKSFIIKIPSRNLYILTYPKTYEFLTTDEIYKYIYEMKQLMLLLIGKNSKTKSQSPLKIQIISFQQDLIQNDQEKIVQKGIVYRKKKQIVDEMEKINNMRKLSLKEQIERINEKKKALKEKKKLKEKEMNIDESKNNKQQTKNFDFIETLKHNIEYFSQELVTKINSRNTKKQKLKRKQRRQLQRPSQKRDQDQQDQIQDEEKDQLEDQQEQQVKEDRAQIINNNDSSKLKSEFKKKMEEEIEKQKRMNEKLSKKQAQKKKSPEPILASELATFEHHPYKFDNLIERLIQTHTVEQLKQFSAYIDLIESLHRTIAEVQKDNLLDRNANLKKEVLDRKNISVEPKSKLMERVRLVKDVLNQAEDTGVLVDFDFRYIFRNVSKNKVEPAISPHLYILPESILEESLNSTKTKSSKNKKPKNSQQEEAQTLQEKQKIVSKIFQQQK